MKFKIFAALFLLPVIAGAQQFGVGYAVGSHAEFNGHLKTSDKVSILVSGNPDRGSVDALYCQSSYLSYGIGVNGVRSQQIDVSYLWHPPVGRGKKLIPGFWESVNTTGPEKLLLGLRLPVMAHYTLQDYPVKLFTLVTPVMTFDTKELTVEASAGVLYYFGQ